MNLSLLPHTSTSILKQESMEAEEQVDFEEFYAEWIDEQKQELHRLIVASETSLQRQPDSDSPSLSVLVTRTVAHYEKYYTVKSKCAKTDVLLLMSPPWTSRLEDAFIWFGGWRPSTAFHLLLSKSGLQFEAKLAAAVSGGSGAFPPDLGDLSGEQHRLIDELQRRTIAEERRIGEKAAKQQEKVADSEMVELSQDATELARGEALDINGRVESAVKTKEEGFQKILQSADDLRLATLKAVIAILTPIQAVHFLIAAAELHLRLHEWGRAKEEREAYQRTPCNAAATPACTPELSTS